MSLNREGVTQTLLGHGWQDTPAIQAAETLTGMCQAGPVSRQQAETVLYDVADEHTGDAADCGKRVREIAPREVERISTALGW